MKMRRVSVSLPAAFYYMEEAKYVKRASQNGEYH